MSRARTRASARRLHLGVRLQIDFSQDLRQEIRREKIRKNQAELISREAVDEFHGSLNVKRGILRTRVGVLMLNVVPLLVEKFQIRFLREFAVQFVLKNVIRSPDRYGFFRILVNGMATLPHA